MQNKTNKQQNKTVANKQAKKAQATEQKVTLLDEIIAKIEQAQKADKNVKMQKVTGYISIKYANKVLFELHAKKKSITHLTFSNKQKVYSILKANKLVLRVVPASYGWKYNTECLLTEQFAKHFDTILKSVIDEAVEARNLQAKQATKKVKTA